MTTPPRKKVHRYRPGPPPPQEPCFSCGDIKEAKTIDTERWGQLHICTRARCHACSNCEKVVFQWNLEELIAGALVCRRQSTQTISELFCSVRCAIDFAQTMELLGETRADHPSPSPLPLPS